MSVTPIGTRMIPGQDDLALAKDGTVWKLKDWEWVKLAHKVSLKSAWYERTYGSAA